MVGEQIGEQVSKQDVNISFMKKHFFKLKINTALKNCKKIEAYLIKNGHLSKYDRKLNLITSDGLSNEVRDSYFLYKTYNSDGSIQPIKKYTIINGEIVPYDNAIIHNIIILDLYEESIYLHSFSKDDRYITGYILKEEIKSKTNKTLIFSNKLIKINIENINKFDIFNVVDDFVNFYIV